MKVLGLDISTNAGWGFVSDDSGEPQLLSFGVVGLDRTIKEYGIPYPWNYLQASDDIGLMLYDKVLELDPDVIVIEETNAARARYTQKILEFCHHSLLPKLKKWVEAKPERKVVYLSSSIWRQALGLAMTKEDKKNNAKLSKAQKVAHETGIKLDKKKLGIRGKINKKHLALRYINERFNLKLKVKDNDSCEALCLCLAYFKNPVECDGLI